MVGVPRSSGCQLCRQRRVKCDEARPECGNCRKYGVRCPGYERAIKFVSGKHAVRSKGSRASRTGRQGSASRGTASETLWSAGTASPDGDSSSSSSKEIASRTAAVVMPLVASPQPSRALFVGTLMDMAQTNLASKDVSTFLSFFGQLRFEALGTSAALDGAICSLSLHLMGKELGDDNLVARSRTVYGGSLVALQAALRHPVKWKASETFCSAVLLCFFELFAGTTSPDTWLHHAQGIATLMEQRGPAAHAQGNDAAILFSFRGILIMSSLFFPKSDKCFLALPEWRRVLTGTARSIYSPAAPDLTRPVVNSFLLCLADMPEVMWWGYPIREALRAGRQVKPERIRHLAQLTAANHERFAVWYEDFKKLGVMPKEVPSEDRSSPYPIVLEHPVGWLGTMLMGYWASMLILQELLILCRWPVVDFDDSQPQLVRNILRSVETMGRGIMGPFRLGYSIRIVYEFANAETQRWIIAMLDRFSKRYAATDKGGYPSPRVDAQGYS
ncbi:hypothetical protein M440DRAFT_1396265 [Trichoderma longibrachiatum ATCC 18648]|uniref:Zn(2)-C6 fungal-type domain-containing protein n=1 Tax=Trichoderma longibrachiatum ATCC 18648 TaxID=983965 RepID=A0A2T4CHQ2_TRILO|nr:hypothetical protein M440DRAFT_1396265 [Trichoderma longibrachiatum ATCC 18648]